MIKLGEFLRIKNHRDKIYPSSLSLLFAYVPAILFLIFLSICICFLLDVLVLIGSEERDPCIWLMYIEELTTPNIHARHSTTTTLSTLPRVYFCRAREDSWVVFQTFKKVVQNAKSFYKVCQMLTRISFTEWESQRRCPTKVLKYKVD